MSDLAELAFTGLTTQHSGYVFKLDNYTINVYNQDDTRKVATIPVLDGNGHRRVHTVPEFEAEVVWWLRDWGVL